MNRLNTSHTIAVVGGGPAGLMAAETLAQAGLSVHLFDAMPSVGRKFLTAGKGGGLNLTHAEEISALVRRYGKQQSVINNWLHEFSPLNLRSWAKGLGIETFVGSSGRVYPKEMKAAPLLRAWVRALRKAGVTFHMRHRFTGWHDNALRFDAPKGVVTQHVDAVVFALGGGSWPKLGSDASWVPLLKAKGVAIAPLEPSNCGFDVEWGEEIKAKYAGETVSSVAITYKNEEGITARRLGQFTITDYGIEGNLIYALSSLFREQIKANGSVKIFLDLAPDMPLHRAIRQCEYPRGSRPIDAHLQNRMSLQGVKTALLNTMCSQQVLNDPVSLAHAIKGLPIILKAPRPLSEAISSAGGIKFEAVNRDLMIKEMPGVFCAGEMLDWEAPTGGYLLTACFASGKVAGRGVINWFKGRK